MIEDPFHSREVRGPVCLRRRLFLPAFGLRDRARHIGIGLDVLHPVIVHHAEVPLRTPRPSRAAPAPALRRLSPAFPAPALSSPAPGPPPRRGGFGLRLSHVLVRLGWPPAAPRRLHADVDVGNVDGKNLERRACIEAACSTVFEMLSAIRARSCSFGRAMVVTIPSPTRDDGVFLRPSDKAVEVGPHGHARLTFT